MERAVVLGDGSAPRRGSATCPPASTSTPSFSRGDVVPPVPGTTIYDLERFAISRT